MRKSGVFALLLLLVLPGVMADSVNYQIFENKVLVEIELDEVLDFSYNLPRDASAIEVSVDYDLVGNSLIIDKGSNVSISYVSEAYIDETKIRSFFIINNGFNNPIDVMLFLDEGAVLIEEGNRLIIPEPNSIGSDGRRVILRWDDFVAGEIIVDYENVEGEYDFVAVVLFVFVLILLFYSLWRVNGKKKPHKSVSRKDVLRKKKKEFTRNLFGFEKKIVEYLFDKKGRQSWTKEIVRDLGISKVKLSRKLRNLEQKGLIVKIPYGNENRIKLKK